MKKIFKKGKKIRLSGFTLFAIFVDICVVAALVVINHPEFKTFWIPTAMTTMSHKVMSENYIEQTTEQVNLDDIVIGDTSEKKHYSSKYERDLFTRMENNEVYKIIRIEEPKYKGYLTVIYKVHKNFA